MSSPLSTHPMLQLRHPLYASSIPLTFLYASLWTWKVSWPRHIYPDRWPCVCSSGSAQLSSLGPLLAPLDEVSCTMYIPQLWPENIAFMLSVYMARRRDLSGRDLNLTCFRIPRAFRVSSSMKQTFCKLLLNLIKMLIERSFPYMFSLQLQSCSSPNLFRWQGYLFS